MKTRTTAWEDAERITDLPAVDEAIRNLLDDQTGDNATALVQVILEAAQPVQGEQVDLYGVKDGVQFHLGKTAMPPRMKARELAREQFGHFEDDDGSDAELCFGALEQLIDWMFAQGFKLSAPATQAQQDPTEHKLPYDVTVGAVTFRSGVSLETFVNAAKRWHRAAYPQSYELTQEQKDANFSKLTGGAA